jgi:hypothetical protein
MDYREDLVETIQSELNKKFHLPIALINEYGAHQNSFRVFVNGIKSNYVLSYEAMLYFQEEQLNQLIDDIYIDYKLGEFVPNLTEANYSQREIKK